jgi:radical SAM protein with 4Fe4S-binding SPASM domain
MHNSETQVDIQSSLVTENTYILRKENDEWLSFQDQNHTITQLGNIALEDISLDGRVVRVIDRGSVDGALSAPIKLFVSVSNECNLSCSHCMSDSSPFGKQLMSPNNLRQISDEAADMGIFQITIGGGEPLLYRGLWDVVSHMRQNYLGVSMTTNAYVVRDSDIDSLKKYNVKTNVSIDGSPETHDRIRNKAGAYDRTITNIRRMIDAGIQPTLRYTMMRSNIQDTEHMIQLSDDLGLVLKPRRAKPSGRVIDNEEIITEADAYYMDAVVKLNMASNCGVEDLMNLTPRSDKGLLIGNNDCGAGTRLAFIDEDGSISPCTFLGKDFVATKWSAGKLQDSWIHSEKFKQIRDLPENEDCSQCDRHSTCHSECPAMRLHVGGSLDAADPGCIKPLVQFLGSDIPVRIK